MSRSLRSNFLSDMTTADEQYLKQFVFDPGGKVPWSKYKFPQEIPSKKTGKYGLTSGTITQPPGTNYTLLSGNGPLQPTGDGFGIMTAQGTTYSKSKTEKSIITSLHQTIAELG
jgi:hypothetical protein